MGLRRWSQIRAMAWGANACGGAGMKAQTDGLDGKFRVDLAPCPQLEKYQFWLAIWFHVAGKPVIWHVRRSNTEAIEKMFPFRKKKLTGSVQAFETRMGVSSWASCNPTIQSKIQMSKHLLQFSNFRLDVDG